MSTGPDEGRRGELAGGVDLAGAALGQARLDPLDATAGDPDVGPARDFAGLREVPPVARLVTEGETIAPEDVERRADLVGQGRPSGLSHTKTWPDGNGTPRLFSKRP